MVTDQQVRRLFTLIGREKTLGIAAAKSGMDEKTARRYRKAGGLPSEVAVRHTWRTRKDPFRDVWEEARQMLELNPGLYAKTIFCFLQEKYPGRFQDGQLRTFQRRVKAWRGTEGPSREVYFAQDHKPGDYAQSDFTSMNRLGVTINHQSFPHLFYHLVLPYSNWETGNICFSESLESLSEGFQRAVWKLGGVPVHHQTDSLAAGVRNNTDGKEFTAGYSAVMKHYGIKPRKTNPRSPNENGDVEQSHSRFKSAVDQSLMLRGSRDFSSREEYAEFLEGVLSQLNAGRSERVGEELSRLGRLPTKRLEACRRIPQVRVGPGSTLKVAHNTYSVNSRLIDERVNIRLYMDRVEVWFAQQKVEELPRLHGRNRKLINYRHVIDWLVRKPGAFEGYVHRDEMFPTTQFRVLWDQLRENHSSRAAARKYLGVLELAARESESGVARALELLMEAGDEVSVEAVRDKLDSEQGLEEVTDVTVSEPVLDEYDALLGTMTAVAR
jgi:transposase